MISHIQTPFIDLLRFLLETALAQTADNDDPYHARIRRFFLQPQTEYTLDELAALWRVSGGDVRDVFTDEIEVP